MKQKLHTIKKKNDKITKIVNSSYEKNEISKIEIDMIMKDIRIIYDTLYELKDMPYISDHKEIIPANTFESSETESVVSFNITNKKTIGQEIINLLYGTTPLNENEQPQNPTFNQDNNETFNRTKSANVNDSLPEHDNTIINLFNTENAQDNTVINDIIETTSPRNIASAINSQLKKDIRDFIGINDKFLLMRDLFSNDIEIYNNTIDQINKMDDINDVYIYMQENFIMNPDNEAVKLMTSILEQRFN